jgi:hypothetical protein
MPRQPLGRPVSPNDPCPFLRALVGEGLLHDGTAPLGDGSPHLPGAGILDANARVGRAELDRLDDFASDRVDADGRRERYLALSEVRDLFECRRLPARMRARLATV